MAVRVGPVPAYAPGNHQGKAVRVGADRSSHALTKAAQHVGGRRSDTFSGQVLAQDDFDGRRFHVAHRVGAGTEVGEDSGAGRNRRDTSSLASKAQGVWALSYHATLGPGVTVCRTHSATPHLDGSELMLKGGQMGGEHLFDQLIAGTE